MSENRCLMCNEIIPEGRMVCPFCGQNVVNDEYNPKILARNKYEKRKNKTSKKSKKSKFYDEDFDF